MSIILDALKKAETERHLGQLPGLHTPRSTTNELQSVPAGLRSRWFWYVAAGGVVLMAIAAVWWIATAERSSTAKVARQVPPHLAFAPAVPALQSVQPMATAQPLPRVESAGLAREIPVPPPLPTPVVKPIPAVAAKPVPPVAVGRSVQSTPVVAAIGPASAPAPEKIITMAELSPALQRELPPLAIGGSMYSDKASERMLLIDKRLLHEGDEVAPNLVLEKLMPKEAILRFRGTRFRIAF